ncbi:MAG: MIP/aquaporin family protein [Gemmatimonadota bacterium]
MKKLLTEFIGTFFLVLTIGLVTVSGDAAGPLAIGAVLMVMVYMGGPISGAHFNPALSLTFLLRGKMATSDFVPYIVAQLLGSIAAAATVHLIVGRTFAPAPGEGVSALSALLIELLFTFALALVVMNVAASKRSAGNSYFGLAIGFTVCAGAYAGGGISGGAFNPAVGIGPTLINATLGGGSFDQLWLYLAGPLAGAVLAAVVFGVQERD